ncbi:tetratricopeptide repeat protein [Pedobacter glucosidilyticus]|uniref:tetratricopeptide repeat protein n=1 Tax=Pedobacter glucosidilyticus TaxID=1122941 RepID=UPI00040474F3|nr:sel1 repeat family protein [Pedobacter glucosidilyticus]
MNNYKKIFFNVTIAFLISNHPLLAQKYDASKFKTLIKLEDGYSVASNFDKAVVLNEKKEITATINPKKSGIWDITSTNENTFAIKGNNHQWAYFNKEGVQLTDFICESPYKFMDGVAVYAPRKEGKFGLMDKTGKILIPPTYQSIGICGGTNYIIVGQKTGSAIQLAIATRDHQLITPFNFNILRYLGNGYFAYAKVENDKGFRRFEGVLNPDLKEITNERFPVESLQKVLKDETITVIYNKKKYLVDSKGKLNPDNGELEFDIANQMLPNTKILLIKLDSTYWSLSKKHYNIALNKGYKAAQYKLDSLAKEPRYIEAHPQLKFASQSKKLDEMQKNADAGDIKSILAIAKAYLTGEGRNIDTTKALAWFQKGIQKSDSTAVEETANIYIAQLKPDKALNFLKTSPVKSLQINYLSETLAQEGGKEFLIAKNYQKQKDITKADIYYEQALKLKHTDAAFEYGKYLIERKEDSKGVKILENNNHHIPSLFYLVGYYGYGKQANPFRRAIFTKMIIDSPYATEQQKTGASAILKDNAELFKDPLREGTVFMVGGVKKVVAIRTLSGFYANDKIFYSSAQGAPVNSMITVLRNESDEPFRKKCNVCNSSGNVYNAVKSGSYTTTDVTYKTGSTISGDKKITTTTTHNTYKSVASKCSLCQGKGYHY